MNARLIFTRAAVAWFILAALAYTFYSIDVILRYAPHALYADQWRQYVDYVLLPFPINVLHPDNGHRLVLPNLIAWFELEHFDGNQWLQILCGIASAVIAASLAAFACWRDRDASPMRRAAAVFLCFFAIFWLANVRTLFHSVELLHTTLPMLFLMLALRASLRATDGRDSLIQLSIACVMAVLATFSFGYGLAVFVGIFGVLIARKASLRQLAVWLGGLAATALLYLYLPGRDGVTASMTLAPLDNLLAGARWLGAPFVILVRYLWDPNAVGLVPGGPLRSVSAVIAHGVSQHWPDIGVQIMPYALFGGAGMFVLIAASIARLRARDPAGLMQASGFGIAWFGLGAAGIVSLSRLSYFQQFPEQIYANRYLPWPCLFWLGLAMIALGARGRPYVWLGRATVAFALLLPLLGWPMQFGGSLYAMLVRGAVDNAAAGSVVGVIERDTSLGETIVDEFVRGVPILRPLHVAQFADPVRFLFGQSLPANVPILVHASIQTRPIEHNLLGDAGTAVTVTTTQSSNLAPQRLLLIDAQSHVVGEVVRDARVQPPGYSGYAQGLHDAGDLRVTESP